VPLGLIHLLFSMSKQHKHWCATGAAVSSREVCKCYVIELFAEVPHGIATKVAVDNSTIACCYVGKALY
jgi:hypothetical protein